MREKEGLSQCALIRIEELYPFPEEALLTVLKRYPKSAHVVWCQEEPENMGAWNYMDRRLEKILIQSMMDQTRPVYVGRKAAASTATGFLKQHESEQVLLVEQALKKIIKVGD